MMTLVLLPGMHGSDSLFADFIAALGSDVRVVTVNYPSDRVLDYAALADIVRPYLPQHEPYVMLGESFSGPVAIMLAAERPAGLAGIVLCGTFAKCPRPMLRPLRAAISWLPMGSPMVAVAAPLFLGRFNTPSLRKAFHQAIEQVAPDVMRARLRAVLDIDCSQDLHQIQVPVLYLRADEDMAVPKKAAEEIWQAIPSMQMKTFPAPHMVLQTMPKETAESVVRFASVCLAPKV